MAVDKKFLAWAQAQAKKKGASSEISNIDKLTSPYLLRGYNTWQDVIDAAKAGISESSTTAEDWASGKPTKEKAAPKSSELQQKLTMLQRSYDNLKNVEFPKLTPGTKEFEDTANLIKLRQQQISDIQTQLGSTKTQETTAEQNKKLKADATKQSTNAATDLSNAKSDLARAQAINDTAAIADANSRIADAQQRLQDAQNKITTVKSGTSPTGAGGMESSVVSNFLAEQQAKQTKPSGISSTGPTGPKSTGGKGTGTTGTGPVPTGATGAPTAADFMAKYAVQAALINSDPGLKDLFNRAMKENWDKDRWKAEFLNSKWSQTHAESWQQAELARVSAPATYAQSYNNMRKYLAQLAVTEGVALDPSQLGTDITAEDVASGKVHNRANNLVEWALDQSWGKGIDANLIKQHVAEVGKINLALPGGQAQDYMSQLKTIANDYGMNSLVTAGGANYFSDAAQSILLGKSTIETWKQDIINQAKTNYKAYAPQLDAGITLKSIAAPYVNTLANLLEINPADIDLSSPTGYGKMVSNALTGSDPANPKAVPLYEFEKMVKATPQWGYTNNARNTVYGGVGDLLKLMGKIS